MPRLLSREEITLFRSLKKGAIVLLLLCRLRRPATATEMAAMLSVDRETMGGYLRGLAKLGCATHTQRGWISTPSGQQLVLPRTPDPEPGAQVAENPAGDRLLTEKPALNLISFSSLKMNLDSRKDQEEERKIRVGNPGKEGTGEAKQSRDQEGGTGTDPEASCRAGILEAFEEAGIYLNRRTRRLAQQPWVTPALIRTLRQEMEAAGKVFPEYAGLLITILESKGTGGSPTRGEATRFSTSGEKDGEAMRTTKPRAMEDAIPELAGTRATEVATTKSAEDGEAMGSARTGTTGSEPTGLAGTRATEVATTKKAEGGDMMSSEGYGWRYAFRRRWKGGHKPDPSTGLVAGTNGMSALAAWEAAKMQLEVELPAGTYTRWVAQARLARYDPIAVRFTLQAHNEYARTWLENRLASTLVRSLTGICGRRVEVEFTGPARG